MTPLRPTLLLAITLHAAIVAGATTDGVPSPSAASPPAGTAKTEMSYQERMKACHAKARGRQGTARCAFLRECLHGNAAGAKK